MTNESNVSPGLRLATPVRRGVAVTIAALGASFATTSSGNLAVLDRGDGHRHDFGAGRRVGDREIERPRPPFRGRGERLDATGKALLDPLQHEPIGGDQGQCLAGGLRGQRADPRRELLGGELARKRGKARRPDGRFGNFGHVQRLPL